MLQVVVFDLYFISNFVQYTFCFVLERVFVSLKGHPNVVRCYFNEFLVSCCNFIFIFCLHCPVFIHIPKYQ
jgi:hypothetical protein